MLAWISKSLYSWISKVFFFLGIQKSSLHRFWVFYAWIWILKSFFASSKYMDNESPKKIPFLLLFSTTLATLYYSLDRFITLHLIIQKNISNPRKQYFWNPNNTFEIQRRMLHIQAKKDLKSKQRRILKSMQRRLLKSMQSRLFRYVPIYLI